MRGVATGAGTATTRPVVRPHCQVDRYRERRRTDVRVWRNQICQHLVRLECALRKSVANFRPRLSERRHRSNRANNNARPAVRIKNDGAEPFLRSAAGKSCWRAAGCPAVRVQENAGKIRAGTDGYGRCGLTRGVGWCRTIREHPLFTASQGFPGNEHTPKDRQSQRQQKRRRGR